MKKNMTNLDIEIRNGVDKMYGIADLPEKQRNSKHKMYMYSAGKAMQADKFKAKLLNFLATKRGKDFVRALPFCPIENLFHIHRTGPAKRNYKGSEFDVIVPFSLPFRSKERNMDCIKEVLTAARIGIPHVMTYEEWKKKYDSMPEKKWKEIPRHLQPKNLTKGKVWDHETILRGYNDPQADKLLSSGDYNVVPYKGWLTFISKKKYRVPSDQCRASLKIQHISHMDADQYLVRLENHKMEKWTKKHPKPTDAQLKQDLFPDLMNVEWNTREHNAREFIRNNIRAKYDKTCLPVIGRFETPDDKWEERIIGFVRDYTHLADHINDDYLGSEMNPILKKAYEIFDAYREHHPNMTNAYIQNAEKTIGRVLTPRYTPCLKLNFIANVPSTKMAA